MKFGIDIGHNCAPDTGAIGLKSEDVLNVEVGDRLIRKLRGAGHEAIDCTPSSARSVQDSLRRRIEKANEDKVLHDHYLTSSPCFRSFACGKNH